MQIITAPSPPLKNVLNIFGPLLCFITDRTKTNEIHNNIILLYYNQTNYTVSDSW